MNKSLQFLITLFSLSSVFSEIASAEQIDGIKIEVFTTQNYHIDHAELANAVYQLDKLNTLEHNFSQYFNLPNDPKKAEIIARKLIHSPEFNEYQAKLTNAYKGIIKGFQNGIKKVPAILFISENHNNAVIYGVTDIKKAIQIYKKAGAMK
ncbi:integrating conjugative element protein [Mergibacter septicus]|uniref:Integrating conjugative element protein n=1 Tax=Mergibacter septicus TaxID=221402 RepID=A0A8D4IZ33_9PAST|nr:TIGR03757 family integrating conjugative element protein [Mergibacter septicus]AWX14734.1 integrating conjugative element protein [Mergibacter septicus]QDJ13985.1 integrating conjugative element protein [Mergibacter septicus]UTU48566.1 TIGR03757 family integrating conjugative element protein [Mergibacter septicus]WMR95805.1 TIGR03757 family integrating conjugative element protein [Mergibacter septicus]